MGKTIKITKKRTQPHQQPKPMLTECGDGQRKPAILVCNHVLGGAAITDVIPPKPFIDKPEKLAPPFVLCTDCADLDHFPGLDAFTVVCEPCFERHLNGGQAN